MVEPRNVRDDPRIVDLGAERGHQNGRAPTDDRAGSQPHAFAGQRVREDGLDPKRPDDLVVPLRRLRAVAGMKSDRRQARELGATLLRRFPAVVVVLDLVDQPVAVVRSQPLDAAGPERQARRLHHRRRVRVHGRCEQDEEHRHYHQPAYAPATTPLSEAPLEAVRFSNGTSRFQDQHGMCPCLNRT
jgi:hypothetical protein